MAAVTLAAHASQGLEGSLKDARQTRGDILIFDPAKVRDAATYLEPHQMSEGMEFVLVNGMIEKDVGEFSARLGGRVVTPDRR